MSNYGGRFVAVCQLDMYVGDVEIFKRKSFYEGSCERGFYTVYGDEFSFNAPQKEFDKYFKIIKKGQVKL